MQVSGGLLRNLVGSEIPPKAPPYCLLIDLYNGAVAINGNHTDGYTVDSD